MNKSCLLVCLISLSITSCVSQKPLLPVSNEASVDLHVRGYKADAIEFSVKRRPMLIYDSRSSSISIFHLKYGGDTMDAANIDLMVFYNKGGVSLDVDLSAELDARTLQTMIGGDRIKWDIFTATDDAEPYLATSTFQKDGYSFAVKVRCNPKHINLLEVLPHMLSGVRKTHLDKVKLDQTRSYITNVNKKGYNARK